ncbi:MAG: ATP-binding cassette domain-containing protein [Pseudomonadota bacterium]
MTQTLALENALVRRREKVILGPLSLRFATRGFTIVLGPNGAGKTTLLKLLHGIERLTEGTRQEPDGVDQGYVFQTPVMLRRSVRENLAYPLKLQKRARDEIAKAVEEWASRIGLHDALERPAPRLSGGERQKLALARALIRAPGVLFLDEPCANLDGRATREIETLLRQAQQSGTRIIMATHDLGQARRLATEVVFLVRGRVEAQAEAERFFADPPSEAARAFLKGEIVE